MSTEQTGATQGLDPFDPLRHRVKTIVNYLRVVVDLAALFETVSRVLSLPPDERFTTSDRIFDEFVREHAERGDIHAAIEPIDPDQLYSFLDTEIKDAQHETLESVLQYREPRDHLIVAMHQQVFRDALEAMRERDRLTPQDRQIVNSCYIALLCRFATFSEYDTDLLSRSRIDDLVYDIAYSDYYLRSVEDDTSSPHPSDRTLGDLKKETILDGAVLAYHHLSLSVNRGAELADSSIEEFAKELSNRGTRPGYGPESVEELLSDGLSDEE